MMRGRWIPLLLVLTPGVVADWSVTYRPQCALLGSTAVIKCSYDYPWGHLVTSTTWSKDENGVLEEVRLTDSRRFEYAGNKKDNCDLKIKKVQYSDRGAYYFGFKTTLSGFTSPSSADLTVSGLTAVLEPSPVKEGEHVRLTCKSGCATSSRVVWYKDGKLFKNSDFPATRESSGQYSCALSNSVAAASHPVQLNVLYAPINVVLRMFPTEEVVSGSSLTLSCSSNANPPVRPGGYRMYKDDRLISSGLSLTIPVLEPSHSGRYQCRAWNSVRRAGQAFMASNDVHLDVKFSPVNVSVSMDPLHVVEGSGVNLTCSSVANPPATHYTWYRQTSDLPVQVGSGPVLSLPSVDASLQGHYLCRAGNHLGESNSTLALLTMLTRSSADRLVFILVRTGGCLLIITLLFITLILWYKQRLKAKKNVHRVSYVNVRPS